MNRKDKEQHLRLLLEKEKRKARSDYYSYVAYTHSRIFMHAKHIKFVCYKLQNAIDKKKRMVEGLEPMKNQYLAFNEPPRHSKSMSITETFPSYYLGHFPEDRTIEASYGSLFAHKFGKKNKEKIQLYGKELFDIELEKGNQSTTDWGINGTRGGMISRGILAGITGEGADLMIIDDPIKNREEANSETYREKLWQEWIDTLSTRLHPGAIVIVILTRWHEDDLQGRLLNPEYGRVLPWDVYNLPLEAEEDDILGRKPGEPLWPDRYGYDFIEERKNYPNSFNALYQGRPTAQEGNMIKREWFENDINWYIPTPEFLNKMPILCMSVDATFKDTSKSDKVDIQIWGKARNSFYLVDNMNARMDFLATLQAIKNFKAQYPNIGMIFVEDKANGSAIINVLSQELTGIVPVNPLGGKESRVQSVLPYLVSNVKLPRNKSFTQSMLQEWYAFPNGTHDDSVDSMTQAISQMIYFYGEVEREQIGYDTFFGKKKKDDNTLCGDFY